MLFAWKPQVQAPRQLIFFAGLMEQAWCGCAPHGTQCKRRCSGARPENERVNASRSSVERANLFRGGYQKRERLVRSLGGFEAIYRRIAMLCAPR